MTDFSRVDQYQDAKAVECELRDQLKIAEEVSDRLRREMTPQESGELNRRNLNRIIAYAESLPRRVRRDVLES